MKRSIALAASLCLLAAACTEVTYIPPDADAVTPPADVAGDTTTGDVQGQDTTAQDTGGQDTPVVDVATTDADTSAADAVQTDSGQADSAQSDSGQSDTAQVDTATTDSGQADTTSSTCSAPSPEGCVNTGCATGQTCQVIIGQCTSSSCACDATMGTWACVDDCAGGTCVDDPGGACSTDADCQFGAQWCIKGACQACDNMGLACKLGCPEGAGFAERNGCVPCQCVPTTECTQDKGCAADGAGTCVAGSICLPWCAHDDPTCCYGNTCESAPSACTTANPQACGKTGCAPGLTCDTTSLGKCSPSSCACNQSTGTWNCTDDCGIGVCVENKPIQL